jgi:VanZ family protein
MRLPAAWRAAGLAAAIVLVVNLFVLGAQPIAVGLIPPPWDKLAHAALFAALGALLMIASAGRWVALAVGVLIAIALADELLQADLPGRVVSVVDLTADVVGAAAGVAAMALALARRASG